MQSVESSALSRSAMKGRSSMTEELGAPGSPSQTFYVVCERRDGRSGWVTNVYALGIHGDVVCIRVRI